MDHPSTDYRMQRRSHSSLLIAIGMMLFSSDLVLCSDFFLKTPIFWRGLNDTELGNGLERRLHDYLSLFPTYGDSKKLGYFVYFLKDTV